MSNADQSGVVDTSEQAAVAPLKRSERAQPIIGIVGLGRMGSAIARRLASTGYHVVSWTRSGRTVDVAAGTITAVPDIASLCEQSDIILLSLFDEAAVMTVVDQLSAQDLTGKLIADTSTVGPETVRSLAQRVGKAGGDAIDAPISGGPEMVMSGTAGIYMGGEKTHVDLFTPVAQGFCNRVNHVGLLGSGATAKIVNNMTIVTYWQGLKEALQVGKRCGLSLETMLRILCSSPAANGVLVARTPVILGETDNVGFTVSAAVKDATLFSQTAARHGIAAPALNAALATYVAHRDKGNGEADVGTVISAAYSEA